MKRRALAAADGRCQQCGRDELPVQVDHRVPDSAGGPNTIDNAVVLCVVCHANKSNAEKRDGTARRTERRRTMVRNVEAHPNAPRPQQDR
ncbi:HNH endonuclease [Microbacterium deminutum]|uniref:HNH endonuclease n=1 Tax=Microbacterium deminutum TaxID=344164 RepID=UPI003CD0AF17